MATLMKLAKEGFDFRYWYSDAWRSINTVCGWNQYNPYLFSAVLAATSPRTQVTRNVRNTLNYFATGQLMAGTMGSIRKAVARLDDTTKQLGDRLSGPKVSTFFQALTGNRDAVTLDSWMSVACGLVGENNKVLAWTPGRIAKSTASIMRVARKLGVDGREAQAAIWTGCIRRAGRTPRRLNVIREHINQDWRISNGS